MRGRTTLLAALAAAAVLLGGCSSGTGTSSASSTTAAPGSTPPVPGTVGTTPGTTSPAGGCTTSLRLTNAAAAGVAGLSDRRLDVQTAWSDEGPHPDNTVDQDSSLEVAIAEFPIAEDPQFGYSIPVGDPGAPPGKVYVSFDLRLASGKVSAGQTFVDSTSDRTGDGSVMSHVLYAGSERLLPGSATVTLTTLTDDVVCGTISSVTTTDLQSFVGVEGTFRLDRIQALEAAEKR